MVSSDIVEVSQTNTSRSSKTAYPPDSSRCSISHIEQHTKYDIGIDFQFLISVNTYSAASLCNDTLRR
jgi:hypothetical protein